MRWPRLRGTRPRPRSLAWALRYGVAAGQPPTIRDQGLGCLLAVEEHAARSLDQDVVDRHTAAEVATVGRVPPAQLLRTGRQVGPHLHPAPRARAGDDAVGRLGLAAVDHPEGERRPGRTTVGRSLEMEHVGLLRVEEEVEAQPGTAGATGSSRVVRVVEVAFWEPVTQAVSPWRGRIAIAAASPCAHSRRATLIEPQSRDGWTRLVSRTANEREVKSMTIEVPV